MTVSRIIEFGIAFLLALILIAVGSFLSLRPSLNEVRSNAASQWEGFLQAVGERNEALPRLVETVRGFEARYGKLAEKLLEARAVSMRSRTPEKIVAATDETDRLLAQLSELVYSRDELKNYPPLASHWRKVIEIGNEIRLRRLKYNKEVELYNRLLTPFPQNMLAALFGFVPLSEYPQSPVFDASSRRS
ncbi:LemA family protein [Thermodesulfobacteriota bacterium]